MMTKMTAAMIAVVNIRQNGACILILKMPFLFYNVIWTIICCDPDVCLLCLIM